MAEADLEKTFNVHEAKTNFSRLILRAHAGEEIIVAKAGVPYVKLVPVDAAPLRRRQPGGLTLTAPLDPAIWRKPLPEEELAYIDDRPEHERR